ncbi:MAG TPA: transglycosylase domain-containing protein, partial [Pseudomonadales bacterium]|nr:transglycosylase domain-containing protein [Pseudomonadales bacterium]
MLQLIRITLATLCLFTLALFGLYLYTVPRLPDVELLREVELETPLLIYSKEGLLIGEFGEQRRSPLTYEEIPQRFIQAILAAEDDQFFSHPGINPGSLLRAALELIQSGRIKSGGSTITMQVAKNYFLSQERTFDRKLKEILLAIKIERELSKQEILALYVNKIYLGNRAYGIQAAAEVYYGKKIDALDLSEIAMIAALPK